MIFHDVGQCCATPTRAVVSGASAGRNTASAADDVAAQTAKAMVRMVDHELRTPLSVILASAELLLMGLRGPLTAEQQQSVETIQKYGRELHTTIEQIIDYADLVRGQIQLKRDRVTLKQLVETCIGEVQPLADTKKIAIQCKVGATKAAVRGDTTRLQQLLVIILNNAISFSPVKGEVGLEIALDQPSKTVQIIIWDTGRGIPPARIKEIFQPFVLLDTSLTRRHHGLGLGLAIAQEVVERHGGMITVGSHTNGGSRFTITLPKYTAAV